MHYPYLPSPTVEQEGVVNNPVDMQNTAALYHGMYQCDERLKRARDNTFYYNEETLEKRDYIPGENGYNISDETLMDYAEYQDMLSAHKNYIQAHQQLEKIREFYNQYEAMLYNANESMFNKTRKNIGTRAPRFPASTPQGTNLEHIYPYSKNNHNGEHKLNEHGSRSFRNLNTTVHCSPLEKSPKNSADSTPNSMYNCDIFSIADQECMAYLNVPERVDGMDKQKPENEYSFVSMASVSTVDTTGDDSYRAISSSATLEDFDFTFPSCYQPENFENKIKLPYDVLKRYRDKVFAEHYFDLKKFGNGSELDDKDKSSEEVTVKTANDLFSDFSRHMAAIPQTPHMIDGRINHDFYRRDFFTIAAEQGKGHLFIEKSGLWSEDSGNRPSPQAAVRASALPSRGNKKRKKNDFVNQTAKGDDSKQVHGKTSYSSETNNGSKASNVSSEESDNGSYNGSAGSDGSSFRRGRDSDEGSDQDDEGNERKKPRYDSSIVPVESKEEDSDDTDKEYKACAKALKGLKVGGMMVISKRRSLKDSQVYVRKSTACYDYLLDIPLLAEPDPELGAQQYKCIVPGVYWDKRSWIASWYEGGARCYSSFSAKMHGFYKAKYFAIQVRLFKTKGTLKPLDQDAVEKERVQLLSHYASSES